METFITNSISSRMQIGYTWAKASIEVGTFQQFKSFRFDKEGNAEFTVYTTMRIIKVRKNKIEIIHN